MTFLTELLRRCNSFSSLCGFFPNHVISIYLMRLCGYKIILCKVVYVDIYDIQYIVNTLGVRIIYLFMYYVNDEINRVSMVFISKGRDRCETK